MLVRPKEFETNQFIIVPVCIQRGLLNQITEMIFCPEKRYQDIYSVNQTKSFGLDCKKCTLE
jgi:hypothetical protein